MRQFAYSVRVQLSHAYFNGDNTQQSGVAENWYTLCKIVLLGSTCS